MNSRLARQLVYGGVFFAIIFFTVIGIYARNFRAAPSCFDGKLNQEEEAVDCGGPCEDCALKSLERIIARGELVVVGNSASAVLRFTNPNIFYGAPRFTYTVRFYNHQNEVIQTLQQETFIYPAQINKTIIEANLSLPIADLGFDPEVSVSNPEWRSAREFSQPATALRQKSYKFSDTKNAVEVSGILINQDTGTIPEAEVGAIIYGAGQRFAGTSKTLLLNLDPFSERFFKIIIPIESAAGVNLEKTEIIVNANRR